MAAANSGLPIVTVTIKGTRSILTGNSWFARRGEISVIIGEPIETGELRDGASSDWDLALQLKERAREQIAQSCDEPDMSHEQVFPPRDI